MERNTQEFQQIAEMMQQDILDGINGNDTMYNIIDSLIGRINEGVNKHESTIMMLDSALDKAYKAGQYDAMDYITLSKQIITANDRELVEAIKDFQCLLNQLDRTSEALHRIEEIIVEQVTGE